MSNILKELTEFAERKAEKRGVDKQVFIWAMIAFCDFLRHRGYVLRYVGEERAKEDGSDRVQESSA